MSTERPCEIIPGSGRRGEPVRLNQVVSVRVDPALLAGVKHFAEADGVPFSEWMRRAVAGAVFERSLPARVPGYRHSGWWCEHFTMTAGVALGQASCGNGCEMLPLYELAA